MDTIDEQICSIVAQCKRSKIKKLNTHYALKLSEQRATYRDQVYTRVRIAGICRSILKTEYTSQTYNYSFIRNKVLYTHPVWVVKILSSPDEEYIPEDFSLEKLSAILQCAQECMLENATTLCQELENNES